MVVPTNSAPANRAMVVSLMAAEHRTSGSPGGPERQRLTGSAVYPCPVLALVTCRAARDVDTDLPLLQRELSDAQVVAWDDDAVDWSTFSVVVLRSPWDYHQRRDDFLAWAADVCAVADLWNPLSVIEWNTDKRYLAELVDGGVPVVPTTFLTDLDAVEGFRRSGAFGGNVVVKPSVGASASGVVLTRDDPNHAAAHARTLIGAGLTPMVQPYLDGVESSGETALVFLGGEFSHGLRRRVVLPPEGADASVLGDERSEACEPTSDERALGEAVIERIPDTAYARVDLLPTSAGPVVLEVEVTEPSLFLHLDERAPARAAAVFRNL